MTFHGQSLKAIRAESSALDDTPARLIRGAGHVCITASSLEGALTYLTGVVEDLNALAQALTVCTAEAAGFTNALHERAERESSH